MAQLGPAPWLARLYRGLIRNETDLHRNTSAMVFAPHQDDESLGCGGTMILKRRAGAAVKLVFMTDGSTSHSRFMDGKELGELRNQEARQAAATLGLDPAEVKFLDFPDSKLGRHEEEAAARVAGLLQEHEPREVFVPYRNDGTPDHEATYRAVTAGVRKAGRAVRVCEYPVWIWNQWPWTPMPLSPNRDTLRELLRSLRRGLGYRMARRFRSGVFVGDVLEEKRAALEQHRSQMTELRPGTGWPKLADVSGGAFLECFFQDFEVFNCWEHDPAAKEEQE